MKKFIFIYAFIFSFDVIIQILKLFFHNTFLCFMNIIISLPLVLIDRSYPFYAEGGALFGITLMLLNILIQTVLVFLIFKAITNYRKTNSL